MRAMLFVLLLTLFACGSDAPSGDPIAGELLSEDVTPNCAACHSLASAGFTGSVAPDLDELQPGYQRVLDALREGPGLMPSYEGVLTDREMHDLAAFISGAAGS